MPYAKLLQRAILSLPKDSFYRSYYLYGRIIPADHSV